MLLNLLNKKYINKCTLHLRMNNDERVEFRISKILLKKLDRVGESQSESRSAVIRSSLRDYLDKKLLMLGDQE